jgi:hypothetical protein
MFNPPFSITTNNLWLVTSIYYIYIWYIHIPLNSQSKINMVVG